jgi:tRNA-dihydrouridine synthase
MEKFKRVARWEYVGMLKQELKIPVVGNGDITSAQDLVRRSIVPCNAVMVGRGAVRMPWIFAEAREQSGTLNVNIKEVGLRFLELLARYQPPEFYISRAQRFFGFFCDNLKWGTYLKNKLNREETLIGFERVWEEYFNAQQF